MLSPSLWVGTSTDAGPLRGGGPGSGTGSGLRAASRAGGSAEAAPVDSEWSNPVPALVSSDASQLPPPTRLGAGA